ncbi:MAG: hypothetical protein ACE5JH_02260 [Acidobacteriota bacterium]
MISVGRVVRIAAGVLGVLLVASGGLRAAPVQGPPRGDRPRPAAPGGEPPVTPEEVREAMEYLMIARMKRVLQLTPRQEEQVIPQMQQLLDARRRFAEQRRARLRSLRALLRDPSAGDAAIERLLAEIREGESAYRRREMELRGGIAAELGPRQQARLLFFERRFHGAMQRRLREAFRRGIGPRPHPLGGPGPGRPPGPADRPGAHDDPLDDLDPWEEE